MSSKFAVGDRVIVTTERWDRFNKGTQRGLTGFVKEILNPDEYKIADFHYQVQLDKDYNNSYLLNYHKDDLDRAPEQQIMNPDVSLDEIHQFQELVEKS